jgi:hypothetical protein
MADQPDGILLSHELHTGADSMLRLPRPNLTERIAILLELGPREVVDFVLLQKGVHLHARFETKATDRAERPKARWTGRLRVPGFQVPREVYPSTSLRVLVQCLLAVQT